jgi:negative regulator of flagellin synthesis FlgM
MKIDPSIQPGGNVQPELVSNSRKPSAQSTGAGASAGAGAVSGEDTVNISRAHDDVQALKASLANVPDVRSDRVAALQQQVNAGQYQPDSGKVADAIIAEQAGRSKTS